MSDKTIIRCQWCEGDAVDEHYHDTQWGVPIYDDVTWFKFLTLEGAQAGLSWRTIVHKINGYENAFHYFDIDKVAQMSDSELEQLREDTNIIRNRLKIYSTRNNAQQIKKIQKEFGSFNQYLWNSVGGSPIQNKHQALSEIPGKTNISDAISKDLKKRGFKFVGSTICYALMQAGGLVNDHVQSCFRYKDLA